MLRGFLSTSKPSVVTKKRFSLKQQADRSMFTLHLCSYSLIPRSFHCPVFDWLGKNWSIYHLSTYVDRGRGVVSMMLFLECPSKVLEFKHL